MHTRTIQVGVLIPSLLAMFCSIAFAGGESLNAGAGLPVKTKAEALAVARAYVGPIFPTDISKEKLDEMIKATISQDTTTPFLSDSLRGRASWEIRLSDVDLAPLLDTSFHVKGPVLKEFIIRVDSATGCLATVQFFDRDYDPDIWERSADSSQRQMRGNEAYQGFPRALPAFDLIDALNCLGMANPAPTKYTVVRYVVHSSRFLPDPVPAWAIHMFGYASGREKGWDHIRCLIHAETGKERGCENSPWGAPVDITR